MKHKVAAAEEEEVVLLWGLSFFHCTCTRCRQTCRTYHIGVAPARDFKCFDNRAQLTSLNSNLRQAVLDSILYRGAYKCDHLLNSLLDNQ